ncbi:hypothetical protein BLOT_016356 [Blomia tropicalis]|nr:hypothetical protein BLOT_016356 [Blomia tropicalis]
MSSIKLFTVTIVLMMVLVEIKAANKNGDTFLSRIDLQFNVGNIEGQCYDIIPGQLFDILYIKSDIFQSRTHSPT